MSCLVRPSDPLPRGASEGVLVVLEHFSVLKDLNALGSVFRISTRQSQFRRALAELVRTELVYHGEEEGLDVPAPDAPRRLRDAALLRQLLLDRATRREFATPTESATEELVLKRGQMLFDLLQAPSPFSNPYPRT